jgi:hypothetical protein
MVAYQLGANLRETILAGHAADPRASLTLLQKLLDVPAARSPKQLLELVLLQAGLPPQSPVITTPAPVSNARKAPEPKQPPKSEEEKPLDSGPTPAPDNPNTKPTGPDVVSVTPAVTVPVLEAESKASSKEEPFPIASDTEETLIAVANADNPSPAQGNDVQNSTDVTELWQQTLEDIKKQYNTLYGIARMAQPTFDGQRLTLSFKFAFHQKRISEAKNRKIFADAIERLYGKSVEIACIVAEPADTSAEKPNVAAISNIFGGAELLES